MRMMITGLVLWCVATAHADTYAEGFESGWIMDSFISQTNGGWVVWDGNVQKPGDFDRPAYEGDNLCYLNHLTGDPGPTGDPYVKSPPLTNGLGSMGFYTLSKGLQSGQSQVLRVDVSSNGVSGWTTIGMVTNTDNMNWKYSSFTTNLYGTQYVRLRKTADDGASGTYLAVDDIQISLPNSCVVLTGSSLFPSPPVIETATVGTFSMVAHAGAASLAPVAWYTTDGGDTWATNALVGSGSSDDYTTYYPGFPVQDTPGTIFDYYIKTEFDDQLGGQSTNYWPTGAPDVTTNFLVDWRATDIFTNTTYNGWNLDNGLIYQGHAWFNVRGHGTGTPALAAPSAFPNGVGEVSMEARNNLLTNEVTFEVQMSADGNTWTNTRAIFTNAATSFSTFSVQVDYYDPAYVRIVKTGDSNRDYHHLVLQNINVTEPTSYVVFTNLTLTPAVPLSGSNVEATVTIAPYAGANNIYARFYYAMNDETPPFSSFVDMEPIGDNQHRTIEPVAIDARPGATLNYYVEVTFQGTTPDLPVTDPESGAHGTLIRAPAVQATYSNVVVTGAGTTNLFAATNNFWRGVVDARSGLTDPSFWFQAESDTWGDASQISNQTPFVGSADADATLTIQETVNRHLYFSFSDAVSNESYHVSECEYVNFDATDWSNLFSYVYNTDGWQLHGGAFSNDVARTFSGRYAVIKNADADQYLRSPALPEGLGAISFWYRNWYAAGTTPAGFYIEKSSTGSAPWTEIARVTNILSPDWLYFYLPVADSDASHVRIRNASDIETDSWICLDEVAVTEPGAYVTFGSATNSPSAPILGDPVTVSVPITAHGGATGLACTVYYRSGAGAPFTTLEATENSGVFSAEIPPSPQGTIEYYFRCTCDGVEPAPASSPDNAPVSLYSFVVAGDLPPARFQNFDDVPGWSLSNEFTNQTYNGWQIWDANVGTSNGFTRIEPRSEPYNCLLNEMLDGSGGDSGSPGAPYIRSPLTSNGLGSVTFAARTRLGDIPQILELQSKTVGGEWISRARYTNSLSDYRTNTVYLNTYDDLYIRIIKLDDQGLQGKFLAIDDILITYPPSDITVENVYHAPAYPAQNQDLTVYCSVSQVNPNYPAFGFEPAVVHRPAGTDAWATNSMHLVSGNTYSGTIPPYPPGNIEYYVRCNFDGVYYQSGDYSESRSPAFSPNAEHTEAQPTSFHGYTIRYYRSDYANVSVTGNFETVASELIGNDTWQGLFYIDATNQLLLGLNADGYAENSEQSTTNTLWGDADQWLTTLPSFGTLDQNGSNIVAAGDFEGFYLLRFDLGAGQYRILAADWQDFNTWPLHTTKFAEGSQSSAAQSLRQTFNSGWALSDDESLSTDFEGTWTNSDYRTWNDTEQAEDWWKAQKFRIANIHSNSNHRLEFRDIAGEGRLRPHADYIQWEPMRGAGTMHFKYRATDTNVYTAICTKSGSANWTNYSYTASIAGFGDNRDEGCYWSLIYHYEDADNYYEMRVISTNTSQLAMAIYKHYDGTVTPLGGPSTPFGGNLNSGGSIKVSVSTSAEGAVNHYGYFGGDEKVHYPDDSSSQIIKGGIGLAARDVNMIVTSIIVSGGESYTETFTSTPSDWPRDATWKFDVDTGTYRRVGRRAGTLGLGVYTTLLSGNDGDPDRDPLSSSNWTLHKAFTNVTTLSYIDGTAEMHRPDTIVTPILKHIEGYDSLRFDDVTTTSWQGDDVTNGVGNAAWLMRDGWIDNDDPWDGAYCELRASRGFYTTDYNQYLRSPLMSTAGPVSFMYRTGGGAPDIAIRWAPHGSPAAFASVTNVTLPSSEEWVRFSYPVNITESGYVQVAHVSSNMNTRLFIDDLTFFDYHEADTNAWIAYNALLTDRQADKLFLTGAQDEQSGYLNYSNDVDTLYEREFEHAPYIRSPYLREGIGEISFWYRNWATNGGLDHSVLVIETSSDATTWTPLASLDIDTDVYTRHVIETYDTESRFVRFRNATSGDLAPDRLCLDSILIAAPIATDLVVSNAWTVPTVPVFTNSVYVRAALTDYVLNPSNVQVTTYFKEGTDDWATWEYYIGTPRGMTELESERYVTNNRTVYVYETDAPIPARAAGKVMQYFVRAEFDGDFYADATSPRIFKDRFQNPAAYYPVDYNQDYGNNGTNTTPYYLVYSCPPGSVWINEVNIEETDMYGSPVGNLEFIELCGPKDISLEDWKIRLLTVTGPPFPTFVTNQTYSITNTPVLDEPTTNGFGFWVLGDDTNAISHDQVFTHNPDANGFHMPLPDGAIQLLRHSGPLEDAVSYGTIASEGNAETATNAGYEFIGCDWYFYDSSLTAEGTNTQGFTWHNDSADRSAGWINKNQTLEENAMAVQTSILITRVWNDTTNTWVSFLVTPTDNALTSSEAWYSTNLLTPSWAQIAGGGYDGSDGTYTQWFDVKTNAPIFYKIEAQDDQ